MKAQGYVLVNGEWELSSDRDWFSNSYDDSNRGFGAFLTLPPGGYRDNGYTTPAPSAPQFPSSLPPDVSAPAGGWGNVPSQGSDTNSFWLPNK